MINSAIRPQFPAPVVFENGVEFLGLTLDKMSVSPGDKLLLNYYWHIPVDMDPKAFTVFFHLKSGKESIVQDDHILLEKIPLECIQIQPVRETFKETRYVTLPLDSPSGDYRIVFGLFENKTTRRLTARGSIPIDPDRVCTMAGVSLQCKSRK